MAIVFIHSGYSPYLEFSLRQARAADPGAEIVLLGDRENDRFPFLRHVDTTRPPYLAAAEAIAAVYEHRSTNGRQFELTCFQRWFVLHAFMEAEGLDDALVLDSDVMVYASEAELRRDRLAGKHLALCTPAEQGDYRWVTSAHVSYWTRGVAEAFCAFVLGSYTEPALAARYEAKWQRHLQTGRHGGICDMTVLYLFAEAFDPARLENFTHVRHGAACDRNLNMAENEWPDEYRMEQGYKELAWEGGQPCGYNTRLGRRVRFLALHCQGAAKGRMAACYRGPSFPGARKLGARLSWYYRARRKASRYVQAARHLRGRLGGR